MAAQALTLLREVARLEAPLEELRALHSVLQAVPLNELREQAAELRLGPLFSLLNENHRLEELLKILMLLLRF
uniref:Proteasome 26S subunit, non-ATPase 5 n=2 Tax=Simiiformes TaxID=314293 RepID=A0A2K5Y9J1_MANLE